jgi:hypothetical protein
VIHHPRDRAGASPAKGVDLSRALEPVAAATPSLPTPRTFSRTSGFNSEPGRGDLRETFEGWMQSKEGHRENLLNPTLREVGIGVATGRYQPSWAPRRSTAWASAPVGKALLFAG